MTGRYAPLFEQGPLAQRGDPRQPGHFYFAPDEHGGVLYLSFDGVEWTKLARGVKEPPPPHADTHADGAEDSLSDGYAPLDPATGEVTELRAPRSIRLQTGQLFGVLDAAGVPLFGVEEAGRIHLPGPLVGAVAVDPAALPARPATVAQVVQVLVKAGLCS